MVTCNDFKRSLTLPRSELAVVPLPLLLSTGQLPMIYMAATVVLKQKEDLLIEAIPRVPTEYLSVGHVLRVWFEGMPAAIGWPGGGVIADTEELVDHVDRMLLDVATHVLPRKPDIMIVHIRLGN